LQTLTSEGTLFLGDDTFIDSTLILNGPGGGTWTFNDLYIANAGSITHSTPDTLQIRGIWSNSGRFYKTTGTVLLNGAADQVLHLSGDSVFYNLILDKPGGDVVPTAGSSITISHDMRFVEGIVDGRINNSIVAFLDNATATGSNVNSYIDGRVEKTGTAGFVFPIGHRGKWARLGMSAPSTNSVFEAQYFGTRHKDSTNLGSLGEISAKEYWDLHRVKGTGSTAVTLYWEDGPWSEISELSTLVVAHYLLDTWVNETGDGGYTGTTDQGRVTSSTVSDFSAFTFGGSIGTLPIELLYFIAHPLGRP
jgi:hypothetical protein